MGTNLKSPKELKISLAQWSLNKAFFAKELDPNKFASITKDQFGITAIEYVNQFYVDHAIDEKFWLGMKAHADEYGVNSLLIMVDDEGDLGNANDKLRKEAVDNHQKWINAAKLLDCHSIRVNAFGDGAERTVKNALTDGLGMLASNAAKDNINVLIENHGLYSSDGKFITDIIKDVGMSNLGTLPDFGNWCMSAKWGSTNKECEKVYDIYQGVTDFLPFAKGVSAKAYDFDSNGNQSKIDYKKMLSIVKGSQFDGYIGIEYEGDKLSEPEGIKATKRLLEKTWADI